MHCSQRLPHSKVSGETWHEYQLSSLLQAILDALPLLDQEPLIMCKKHLRIRELMLSLGRGFLNSQSCHYQETVPSSGYKHPLTHFCKVTRFISMCHALTWGVCLNVCLSLTSVKELGPMPNLMKFTPTALALYEKSTRHLATMI